ncbi:MAG: 2-oxoglutarate dehydrogenase complex dihydrolipoyllysine-residue succinyltransferase [Desulforhabdus sp.]|jgi:2-oxoglutarate dehydrogenase E2 component (dihydrolipoamide succinyltransferase)|nr:2-oxoglutarate dehydrogenase complex dihydrolipoyllysine-residue succinyltransferase [Desulforhabdus sp.]
MKLDVRIPEVGESVQEAVLAQWYKQDGERVVKDEILFVIETDKVTLEIAAEAAGVLHIMVGEGETVAIGTVVATIEVDAEEGKTTTEAAREQPSKDEKPARQEAAPEPEEKEPAPRPELREQAEEGPRRSLSPAVRRLAVEKQVDVSQLIGTGPGGRITKGDVLLHLEEARPAESRPAKHQAPARVRASEEESAKAAVDRGAQAPSREAPVVSEAVITGEERTSRKAMSPIRQRIAERLLTARQSTATLTTFNEIDMSRLQAIRARFKESFKAKYGVSLGLMSFFVKASVVALKEFPQVNAFIEGKDIVYHHYHHIGVAVGAERGLVVPVIRHADRLTFAEIEREILDYVQKIKENRLDLADLEGGTFTISNGGIYGSLLSTPILNTPQSGILGMHKIEDRPVVVDGEIVVRPMMYVALSYDHRIVDGREAVTFLKRIKECIENPERIMMEI